MKNRYPKSHIYSNEYYGLRTRFVQRLLRVLGWASRVFVSCPNEGTNNKDSRFPRSDKVLLPFLRKLDTVLLTRGPWSLILYVKGVRTQLLCYLSGSSERVPGITVTSDGIPKCLGDLIPWIRAAGSPEKIEKSILPFLCTVLWSTRSLKPSRPVDLSTIVDPPLREPIQVGKWIPAFWRALGYRPRGVVPGSVRFKSYHFTTKAGPNGHALGHYLDDAEALPDTLINHIGVVAGDKLKDRIILLRQERDVIRGAGHLPPPPTSLAIRKLVAIDDMEGKKRVIAELDYFSQAALKPLHAYLFRVLKKIPQDRTFSQSGFVRGFDGLDCEIISADLTAATDRFPLSVIAQVLEGVLPPEYVQS
jgi:hypothetical protein